MQTITSKDNELIKHIRKLKDKKYRDESNEYLVEGVKLVEEAVKENAKIKQIIVCEDTTRTYEIPTHIMLEIARIKILCKKLNISKVQGKRSFAVFTFELGEFNIDVNELAKNYRNRIKFSQGLKPQITYVLQNATGMKMLKEVEEFLKTIDDFRIKENK